MNRLLPIFVIIAIGIASVSNSQEPSDSTPQVLKEFGEFTIGRWTGEGTLEDDVPGLGKKGEKIVGQAETRWDLEGTVITCRWSFGAAKGTWIATWDPVKKAVKRYHFSSTGNHQIATVSQKKNKWIGKIVGSSEEKKLTVAFPFSVKIFGCQYCTIR